MNKFLKEFKDRGFFYQCTDEHTLSELLDKKKIRLYGHKFTCWKFTSNYVSKIIAKPWTSTHCSFG